MRNNVELLSLDESPPLPPESPPSAAAPPWTELPSDVTANILQRLDALEILQSAQLVCSTWWKVCKDPAMWRVMKIVSLFPVDDEHIRYNNACRHAVDRSQGQLVDLNINYEGEHELFNYIVNRSSHLRRLTLRSFYRVSGAVVAEAVKKLPELEEFHLLTYARIAPADIESIATSCPSLNSLSLDFWQTPLSHNDRAVAISKFMPRLQHLKLDNCEMDNMGLEAILDGCHHLQSLDLQGCCHVDLGGALGERCRDHIKDLLVPLLPASYYIGDYCYDDDYATYDGTYNGDNNCDRDSNDYNDYGYDNDGYDDYGHTTASSSYWSKLISFFTYWSFTS